MCYGNFGRDRLRQEQDFIQSAFPSIEKGNRPHRDWPGAVPYSSRRFAVQLWPTLYTQSRNSTIKDVCMNRYGLPEDAVALVRKRDRICVYCQKEMSTPGTTRNRADWATIEHLNHLPPWDNPRTIAICCLSCNSSRGNKPLLKWFESSYCRTHKISLSTVAKPVRDYMNSLASRRVSS